MQPRWCCESTFFLIQINVSARPYLGPHPFAAPRHFLIEVNARRAVILEGRSCAVNESLTPVPGPQRNAVMISKSRPRRPSANAHLVSASTAEAQACSLLGGLGPHATAIRTRLHQKLALTWEGSEIAYLVASGTLVAHATLPADRHQILAIYYPGDLFRSSLMPPLSGAGLTAVAASGAVWRMRWPALEAISADQSEIARLVTTRLTEQAARLAMHAAIVGSLAGEERVAALLIELALRLGTVTAGETVFDMPLSRADVAAYLALNADTVSRIVSRLRGKGLLAQSGRRRLICRDMGALYDECPIARVLEDMHGPGVRRATDFATRL
jgi:CRP-like cAMP-binding protein